MVDDDRRIIGLIQYESKLDTSSSSKSGSSSFTDPSITLYSPDDYRHWRRCNPEPKNIICYLPLSVHFELSFRQLFTSGFDIVDITPEKIVMPKDFSLRCKPLTDKELFYLSHSYGTNGDRMPKFNKKEVSDFVGLIESARYQFSLTQLVQGGKCNSMFNSADLSDQYVVQNILELPDDVIQDFDVFAAYKRIRHNVVNGIETFQTDKYIAEHGTRVGIFYDFNTNPTHTKSKLVSNVRLNLIANKFNSEISGTFLELPSNHKNRLEIDISGHLGHKISKQKKLPKPVAVRGASIWDVSNHKTPSPLYKNEKSVNRGNINNTTIFGKKIWAKPNKKLFHTGRIVDIDIGTTADNIKQLKKVSFVPKQPPIQVFQALGDDSSRTLDLSATIEENNPVQTDIPDPNAVNAPMTVLNTSIDYQNPVPGPSNSSPTGHHQPVRKTMTHPNPQPKPKSTNAPTANQQQSTDAPNPNLTTYSDFFNNWRLTFVHKGPSRMTVNESNQSTEIQNNWLNILGDLHRFQSQFRNQFQQLLKEYQIRMVTARDNEESLVPEPARAILMMNEINVLARCIQNNSSDFDKLRDHITQCVFGIVSTFYSNEISRPTIDPIDPNIFSPTLTLSNEVLAYLDNVRDSLMNLRPFPTTKNQNHSEKESKILDIVQDFHDGIKPFLDAIVQKYESSRNEIESTLNAPGSSASNTPNITPPQHSTQRQDKDGNFEFKSDGSSPRNDNNQGQPDQRSDQTIPSEVLNDRVENTPNTEISALPSNVLALFDSTNKQPPNNPSSPKSTRNDALPQLEKIPIDEIQKTPENIVPASETANSPEIRPKSKKGRFVLSSEDSDTENQKPSPTLNRSYVASRTRKRTASKGVKSSASKKKKL